MIRFFVAAGMAVCLAAGLMGKPAAAAEPATPAALVQTVQYYGPGYYRGPPPGYYGRRFYGRPYYGRGYYGRGYGYGRGFYGRGYYGRRFR